MTNIITDQLKDPINTFTEDIQQKMDDHNRIIEKSTQKAITLGARGHLPSGYIVGTL